MIELANRPDPAKRRLREDLRERETGRRGYAGLRENREQLFALSRCDRLRDLGRRHTVDARLARFAWREAEPESLDQRRDLSLLAGRDAKPAVAGLVGTLDRGAADQIAAAARLRHPAVAFDHRL